MSHSENSIKAIWRKSCNLLVDKMPFDFDIDVEGDWAGNALFSAPPSAKGLHPFHEERIAEPDHVAAIATRAGAARKLYANDAIGRSRDTLRE